MKKKIISLMLVIAIILSVVPLNLFSLTVAAEETNLEWEYLFYSDGVVLTDYNGNATDILIPDVITDQGKDYPVRKLGDSLFEDNDSINSVTLCEEVISIGDRTFYDADNLVCVLVSEKLKYIGDEAFYSCDIMNSIILYDFLMTIGENAFSECPKLVVWCNNGSNGYSYVVKNNVKYELLNPNATPETYTQDGLTYYIYNGEAHVIGVDDTLTEVEIPSVVIGYPVTSINEAFKNKSKIKSVELPNTLKKITADSFRGCGRLSKIIIPDSVTEIGSYAFAESAFTEVVLSRNVKVIKQGTFDYCRQLKNILLPEGLEKIGYVSFQMCQSLEEVKIPSTVTDIGQYAFNYCRNLKKVNIPSGVEYLWNATFNYCGALTTVEFSEGLKEISYECFKSCTSLKELDFPQSLYAIGNYAFDGCTGLTEITFPENMKYIDGYAFQNCSNLKFVYMPSGNFNSLFTVSFPTSTIWVVYQGSYAHNFAVQYNIPFFIYDGVSKPVLKTVDGIEYLLANGEATITGFDKTITEIVIPPSVDGFPVKTIKDVFKGTNIASISLPEGLTTISDYAFQGCWKLEKVTIPDSVTKIGKYAFGSCSSLTEITLPKDLKEIEYAAFSECRMLRKAVLPEGLEKIGRLAFQVCDKLEDIVIPETVTEIGEHAFAYCRAIKKINIPSGIKYLYTTTFTNCIALEEIEFSEGLKEIGHECFKNCYSLKELNFPESLVCIGNYAFDGCNALTEITFSENMKSIYGYAFANCSQLKFAYMPSGDFSVLSGSAFPSSTVFAVYEGSYAHKFALENNRPFVIYNGADKPQLVTVNGIDFLISNDEASIIDFDKTLTEIVIPQEIEGVPIKTITDVFKDSDIEKVTLPEGITTISDDAFRYCGSLKEINIPDSVTIIGTYAFSECNSLTEIVLPKNLKEIEQGTFNECDRLKKVVLPEGLETIGYVAFQYCPELCEITIPSTVKDIGEASFNMCYALKKINIPSSVETLRNSAFAYCKALEEVEISEGLKHIPYKCFINCYALTEIVLPRSLLGISNNSFENCYALKNVVVNGNLSYISGSAFNNCNEIEHIFLPESVSSIYGSSLPGNTIWLVYEGSYAHNTAIEVGALYHILRKSNNPLIAYGSKIEGCVTYPDGTPADATVEIYYEDGKSKDKTTTKSDGTYQFNYAEVGRYTIKVKDAAQKCASGTVSVKRINVFEVLVTGNTDFTLKKGHTITGHIQKTTFANVYLKDKNGNIIHSVITDTNGDFEISGISTGEYIIYAENDFGSFYTETFIKYDTSISFPLYEHTATIEGCVKTSDRSYNTKPHEWAYVELFAENGCFLDSCYSDENGNFTFDYIPKGNYVIVASGTENRMDPVRGYERMYSVTGYLYLQITEHTVQTVDVIMYEDKWRKGSVDGTVNAFDETDGCEVILRDCYGNEMARTTANAYGKYSFKNVEDGMYFITAKSKSYGSKYVVITLRYSYLYGKTDIYLTKNDPHREREYAFLSEMENVTTAVYAKENRERIAEEKRFYDSLTPIEQKQLYSVYVYRLNELIELLGVTVVSSSGAKTELTGLSVSADEILNYSGIEYSLSVTEDAGIALYSGDKITLNDYLDISISDSVKNYDILKKYDITLTKTVDGKTTEITDISKNTDCQEKLRIVLNIPEEYRGYKHYNLVHEHCGEITVLTDLDDNLDTITVETDKFSTFVLSGTDEEVAGEVLNGDINGNGGLNSEDLVLLKKVIFETEALCSEFISDLNNDGKTDVLDVIKLKKLLLEP